MLKDTKRLVQTVWKMDKAIRITKELKEHTKNCIQQNSATSATAAGELMLPLPLPSSQPEVQPVRLFLPALLPITQPSQLFPAPQMCSPPVLDPPPAVSAASSPMYVPLLVAIAPTNLKLQELASSEIDKARLKIIPDVLQKYSMLRTECKMSLLVVKLAREAIMGDCILKQCTPRGWNDLLALAFSRAQPAEGHSL